MTFVMRPAAWAYGVAVAANWIGKAKTGLQFALMMLVPVRWIAEREHFLWLVLATRGVLLRAAVQRRFGGEIRRGRCRRDFANPPVAAAKE